MQMNAFNWVQDKARALRERAGPWIGEAPRRSDGWVRMPLWRQGFPFLVLTAPKAGSSVVAKWFFWQLDLLEEALRFDGRVHRYEALVHLKQPGYARAVTRAAAAGTPAIRFLRDPAARAYSAYLELCRDFLDKEPDHWAARARRQALQRLHGKGVNFDHSYSFVDHVTWLSCENVQTLNKHLRPQLQRVDDALGTEIVTVDDLSERLDGLAVRFALKPLIEAPAELLASRHHHDKVAMPVDEALRKLGRHLPRKRRNAQLPKVNARLLADTELGATLARIYARDFVAYEGARPRTMS